MKLGKTPGHDGITEEMLRCGEYKTHSFGVAVTDKYETKGLRNVQLLKLKDTWIK